MSYHAHKYHKLKTNDMRLREKALFTNIFNFADGIFEE
jgi:hypothetical protein